MITADTQFTTAIKRGYSVEGSLLVIAEWNFNNLFDVTVTNDPDDQNWIMNKDYFPPKSVATGIRPTQTGLFYGITGEAMALGGSEITQNRYYTASDTTKYKYWICPTPSSIDPVVPEITSDDYEDISIEIPEYSVARGALTVDYGQYLNMNKVAVTFNLGPIPLDWSLYVWEQTAGDWIEIANPTVDVITGRSQMWWNGTSWTDVQQLDQEVFQRISKVKIEVRTVDTPNRRLQVVDLAGKREVDMTGRIESSDVNSTMDSVDYMYPVGRMSANDGKIVLNNNDLVMDAADPSSDFYGCLFGWCQYRTYVKYDLAAYGGDPNYLMRTSTMYANDHQQVNEYQYEVELFDIYKIIQSIDCPAALFENKSIAKIFQTLLDMVGIDTYQFEFTDYDNTSIVKYFWTDGTKKLFEVLDELCQSNMAASFIDEFGMIRLLTRTDITLKDGEVPVWTFLGENDGLDIPDIATLHRKYELQVNQVNVKYTRREAKVDDTDITEQPQTSSIWEASDTIVLRASPLIQPLGEVGVSELINRSFEFGDTTGWTVHNCTLTATTERVYVAFYQGQYSGKIVPNGVSTTVWAESSTIKVPSARLLQVDAQVWANSAIGGDNFSFTVNWYDENMALIVQANVWRSLTPGQWNFVSGVYGAPLGAAWATVSPTLKGTPSGSQAIYVDELWFYQPGMRDAGSIWISSTDAETWPFKGKANIDGEVIEYDGKGYAWWDYTTGVGVYRETVVNDNDERKTIDRQSYTSWKTNNGIIGGVSNDPTKQNHYTGRLWVTKRDADGTGQSGPHYLAQSYGWYIMDFWTDQSYSTKHPGKYFTPGHIDYNLDNLKDWVKKPGWGGVQSRVSVANSIVTVDNHINHVDQYTMHATVVVRDLGDTEFREFGTRLRISSDGVGRAMIPFYMSDDIGYDTTTSPLTEAYFANRCYVINVQTSEYCDKMDRAWNEVSVHVKNGDSLTRLGTLPHLQLDEDTEVGNGKIKIDADKWYDVDVVFKDGVGEFADGLNDGCTYIEVYIDGAYLDTWKTQDNIRPTGLFGFGAKDLSKVDFEDFYATTTTNRGRNKYLDEDKFDGFNVILPAGTNVTKKIAIPKDRDWDGYGVISLSTWGSEATVTNMELSSPLRTYVKNLTSTSPIKIKPDQRYTFQLNDVNRDTGYIKLTYTAAHDISLCAEYTQFKNYPYVIENDPIPPTENYYDLVKGGFVSSKKDELLFEPQRIFDAQYNDSRVTVPFYSTRYYDDFGPIVHEIREFDVEYDTAPAKGVGIYCSNEKAKIIGHKFNPARGKFTLVNTSHRNEIINGTEELDASNSIDYSLMMYGYVLVELGDETETVQNDLSIIRHGIISQDLDASWIFNKEDAKSLGEWITSHWGDAMDTLSMDTFLSTHIQIGDKINIKYPITNIDISWIYIVTGKEITFDGEGLAIIITVRRVR